MATLRAYSTVYMTQLVALSDLVQNGTQSQVLAKIAELASSPEFQGVAQQKHLATLARVIDTGTPEFSIFAENGNGKLPFVAFSSLPGVTCPGAGECLNFCYSFKAWRYMAVFAKQAQNAWLLRRNPSAIAEAFAKLASKKKFADGFDFRLYVDGDFATLDDVEFWQDLLKKNPTVRAYGYTKSFALFLEYANTHTFAPNYLVNLSSGHNADPVTSALFEALPVVRGKFSAVSIGRKVQSSEHGTREVNTALRAAYQKKAFVCGGKCGDCTPKGHACGLPTFQNVDIIIAVH